MSTQNPEYWKERLKFGENSKLHYSVWMGIQIKELNDIHKAFLDKNVGSAQKILDVGCGYGRCSDWFDDSNYTGIDFSPDFIKKAVELFPRKHFVCSDIRHMPFIDKQFDVAVAIGMEHMFKREGLWEEVFNEMKSLK